MSFHQKPNKVVSSVSLNVLDIERSKKFYTQIIGLRIVEESDSFVSLSANGRDVLLNLYEPDSIIEKNHNGLGLYHFALLLPNKIDLANLIYHLLMNDIRLAAGDHLVSEAFYIKDPDNNDIELYIDRDPDEWNWHDGLVEMATNSIDLQDFISYRSTDDFTGISDSTIMGHIHLYVSNLQASEEFYTQGLGFEVVSRLGDSASFMSDGKYHHHIAINTWQGRMAQVQDEHTSGLKDYTIIFNNENDKEEALNRLQGLGYLSYIKDDDTYVKDPDQNIIHLKV